MSNQAENITQLLSEIIAHGSSSCVRARPTARSCVPPVRELLRRQCLLSCQRFAGAIAGSTPARSTCLLPFPSAQQERAADRLLVHLVQLPCQDKLFADLVAVWRNIRLCASLPMHVLRQARANEASGRRWARAAHAALSRGEQLDCRLHQQQPKKFVFKRQEHVTQH